MSAWCIQDIDHANHMALTNLQSLLITILFNGYSKTWEYILVIINHRASETMIN